MKINYEKEIRTEIALAALAVQEAGCQIIDILGHRVWFTFDGKNGNICVQCFNMGGVSWVITWPGCREAPELKTYKELLKQIKKELLEFKNRRDLK